MLTSDSKLPSLCKGLLHPLPDATPFAFPPRNPFQLTVTLFWYCPVATTHFSGAKTLPSVVVGALVVGAEGTLALVVGAEGTLAQVVGQEGTLVGLRGHLPWLWG